MNWTQELLEELQLLSLFPADSLQEGLKIHSNAAPERIAAAERLFAKGLISQQDGGYLSLTGIETQGHLTALANLLVVR